MGRHKKLATRKAVVHSIKSSFHALDRLVESLSINKNPYNRKECEREEEQERKIERKRHSTKVLL